MSVNLQEEIKVSAVQEKTFTLIHSFEQTKQKFLFTVEKVPYTHTLANYVLTLCN